MKEMEIPHLKIDGEGQPFVWLHGMLNSVESDSVYSLIDFNQISKLVSVVRYDVCNKSVTGDYSWDASTEELIRIADAQNYSSVILGGSSMGSGTAIHCTVRFPEKVKALILVTPPPAWEMRAGVKALYEKIASKANQKTIPNILQRIIQRNQDPPEFYEQRHPGARERLLEYRLSFEPSYYSQIYLGGAASDFPPREQIAQIAVPTLIVALPDDVNHPLDMAQELNALIRGSELVVISDYHNYQELQKKVFEFMDEVSNNNKS
jgi:pimeloyl-ACP methyl ester carboxylesterase